MKTISAFIDSSHVSEVMAGLVLEIVSDLGVPDDENVLDFVVRPEVAVRSHIVLAVDQFLQAEA